MGTPHKTPQRLPLPPDDPEPSFDEGDTLLLNAARLVIFAQFGSTSILIRRIRIGAVRVAGLMNQLEAAGIVGPTEEAKSATCSYRPTSSRKRSPG